MRIITILLLAALVGCGAPSQDPGTKAPEGDKPASKAQGTPAEEIGIRTVSVFEATAPDPFEYGEAEPGASQRVPTAYGGSPPVISHAIDDFLPIQVGSNQCLDCHDASAADESTPAVPESHYRDLRAAPDTQRDEVAGARYVCTSCHVPQADVEPAVENTFKS